MSIKYLPLVILLIAQPAWCDSFGLRLNSRLPTTNDSIVAFPPGGLGYEGKLIQGVYDWEPHPNFYVEGAFGYRSWNNIFDFSSIATEISPGFKVTAGYFVFKLSEGVSFMPQNTYDPVNGNGFQKLDFVTHVTFGLKDPKTGIGIYLDRSHYSNGQSHDNPSLNYSGFMVQFPIGKVK